VEGSEDNRDIEEESGQMRTEVKIVLQRFHNVLIILEEYVQ